jgi:hypothetical protein
MRILRVSLVGVALVVAVVAGARGPRRPPTVEIDGCVMPATACTDVRGVVKVREGDRKLELAVERVFLPGSTASPSQLLTELKLRGMSVHGPSELTTRLVAGAHLRIRGLFRPGPMMLLQSVEPRPDEGK